MKKLGILFMAMVLVFGMCLGVMASYTEYDGTMEDGGEVQEDIGVNITVDGWAVVQIEDGNLTLDIEDPTIDEQTSNEIGVDVHSNTKVNTEFKSLGMNLPDDLESFIENNPDVDDFHPAEYFEYNAIEKKGGPHSNEFYPDVEDSNLDYITEVDKNHGWARYWYGSNSFSLSLEYTHHDDLGSSNYMEVDGEWLGWEPLMDGTYSDTIQVTVSAQ